MIAPSAIGSLVAICGIAALLAPSTAMADPATAEALFREGRRLLDEGKTDEACLKLAESQAQDPSSGTLLNLGLCHEMQHKIATAWSDYVSAARYARDQGRADRAAAAEKKAAQLEVRLPHLTVTAASPAAGLAIERGGHRLGPGALGSAVPLDPGSYMVTASAPGHKTWKATIDVAEAESKTVQVPELEAEAPAATEGSAASRGSPAIAPVPTSEPPPPAVVPPPASRGAALGWVIGGTGVAAIAVGAAFGFSSLASYRDASSQCPTHNDCTQDALSVRSSAESKAWVSNIAVVVGVVGIGIGSWILLSPRPGGSALRVGVHGSPDARGGMRVSLEQRF